MKQRIKAIIQNNDLLRLPFEVDGNARVLLLLEPLWGIPYYLIAPFLTLYMRSYGLSDVTIGNIITIFMVFQLILGFVAGPVTDKFGRKNVTIFGDSVGWGVANLIFALATNSPLFLIAYLFNSFEQINQTAWVCLLSEDTKEKHIINLFSWITIGGLVSVLFAPLSGVLINKHGLTSVISVLYIIFSITMFLKGFITYKFCVETKQGKIRMAQTKNSSVKDLITSYKEVFPKVFKHKETFVTLLIMAVLSVTTTTFNSFLNPYTNENRGISLGVLSFMPIVRSVVMLLFMVFIQSKIRKVKKPALIGFSIYILTQLTVIFMPYSSMPILLLITFLEALAFALVHPRKDMMVSTFADRDDRARVLGLMTALMFAFTAPFGSIAGLLASIDRRLVFVLNIALFLFAMIVVSTIKEPVED